MGRVTGDIQSRTPCHYSSILSGSKESDSSLPQKCLTIFRTLSYLTRIYESKKPAPDTVNPQCSVSPTALSLPLHAASCCYRAFRSFSVCAMTYCWSLQFSFLHQYSFRSLLACTHFIECKVPKDNFFKGIMYHIHTNTFPFFPNLLSFPKSPLLYPSITSIFSIFKAITARVWKLKDSLCVPLIELHQFFSKEHNFTFYS